MADHYAVLGLAPYAEHSAVRSAYLELMRRYHPDINSSAEAAARAREVTAAYEVLGHPDSRIDYDLARAQAHAAMAQDKSRRPGSPALAGVAAVAAAGLLALLLIPSPQADETERTAAASVAPAPRQQEAAAATPVPRLAPAPAPARTEEAAAPRIPVELPQTPGRGNLEPSPASIEAKRVIAPVEAKPRGAASAVARPEPRRAAIAKTAKSTKDADLPGLDQHLGILFRQSMRSADAAKQQSLYRDHYRFVERLNACSTTACKEREYLARMGEVSSTMAAKPKSK